VVVGLAIGSTGCTRQDARLRQHQEQFESLGSTAAFIAEAWLAGSTSGTYTTTALSETFRLVEQERTALASSPQTLIDPRGARLSQLAEALSRVLATMVHDVRAADAPSLRRHISEISIRGRK
jgi:hypothetical protein